MKNEKITMKKSGNIFILVGIVIIVVIFASTVLLYFQINIITENIRHDLFYAASSSRISFDVQDLAYRKYTINKEITKEVIEDILNKNYIKTGGSVTKLEITRLDIEEINNKVNLKIQLKVTFKSVINIDSKAEHSFKMNEEIKIYLMDYTKGER